MTVSRQCPFKKQLNEFREIFVPITKVGEITRKGLTFITKLGKKVSSTTSKTVGATQFLSFVTGVFFNLPKTIASTVKIFTASRCAVRVQSIQDASLGALNIFSNTVNTIKALSAVGAIGTQAWTAAAGKILYPVACFNLGTHIHNMIRFAGFYDKLKLRVFDKTKKEAADPQNIIQACKSIEEKVEKIQKNVGFSQNACIKERVQEIQKKLEEGSSIEKAQDELFTTLRNRVNTKIAFHIVDTVLRIASVVMTGGLVFGVSTSIVAGVILGVAVAGFALSMIEKAVLPKNPFDEDIWQNKAVVYVENVQSRIESVLSRAFCLV